MSKNNKVRHFIGVMFDRRAASRSFGYEVHIGEKRYLRFYNGYIVCLELGSADVFFRKFGNFAFDVDYYEDYDFWKVTNDYV